MAKIQRWSRVRELNTHLPSKKSIDNIHEWKIQTQQSKMPVTNLEEIQKSRDKRGTSGCIEEMLRELLFSIISTSVLFDFFYYVSKLHL